MTTEEKIAIGARIRAARIRRNFTQKQLAEKADISVGYLGNIEHGRNMPRLRAFVRIINALGVNPDSVLFGVPPIEDI